jgi:hypothetical protein
MYSLYLKEGVIIKKIDVIINTPFILRGYSFRLAYL